MTLDDPVTFRWALYIWLGYIIGQVLAAILGGMFAYFRERR